MGGREDGGRSMRGGGVPGSLVEGDLFRGFRDRLELRTAVERPAPDSLPRCELESRRSRRRGDR